MDKLESALAAKLPTPREEINWQVELLASSRGANATQAALLSSQLQGKTIEELSDDELAMLAHFLEVEE